MQVPLHPEFSAWTLADYLALLWPDRPQRAIAELFAKGRLRSEGKPVGLRRTVGEIGALELVGSIDALRTIYLGEAGAQDAPEVLHEDGRLVALSKPSGLPVVPDREQRLSSILGWLIRREIEARASKQPAEYVRFRIVHRIDRLTSGLVIVAKTPEAERDLSAAFEDRRVRKEYCAILAGVVRPARFAVNCPVVPGRKGKMRAELTKVGEDDGPGAALTEFDVLERFSSHTLVRARPLSGRTHQIRVHAWASGHPLAIDPLYGQRPEIHPPPPGISRLTLHARRYQLPAEWAEPRDFECPPAPDFAGAVRALRKADSPV